MFLSAASATLVLVAPVQDRLNRADQSAWRRLTAAVATLMDGARPVGPAALVDDSGLFVAHSSAVTGNTVNAKLGEKTLRMVVLSRERNTELVLLKADEYEGTARPFRPPVGDSPNGAIFAVLSTGPIRAEHVPVRRYGVLGSTRRGVPITEFRFEAPEVQFGTGLLLTEGGEFFGTVNAALSPAQPTGNANAKINQFPIKPFTNSIGPSSLTVAYAVGPEFVRRVLEGFLSPAHEVVFPAMGIMCVDNIDGGALIQVVRPGTPAAAAGLQVGDVLLDINSNPIHNQLDFSRVMLRLEVGKKVPVRIRRGNSQRILDVIIGRAGQ
ncbi:MAG: PDZ domain-containing protein [Fimbriimonas sp.]